MIDTNPHLPPPTDIRIIGLNTDKTCKSNGSDIQYQVYFQLSVSPPRAWRDFFEREWKLLHPVDPQLYNDTVIDRGFLVLQAPLQEVTLQLSVLKKAVAAANVEYNLHTKEQAREQKHLNEVWKLERNAVNEMVKTLLFD